MRRFRLPVAVILALGATLTLALADTPAASPGHVPEPAGLYQGPLHGYVPGTLKGGTVLDTPAFVDLIAKQHPLLIDVANEDRKPANMPKSMPWLPEHRSIPGAIWLQGAGSGTSDAAFAAAFKTRVTALTGGDATKPIVVFCHPDCWASYNAARRLVGLGYTHVYWYPEGMEGWQNDHETAIIKPDQAWGASLPKDFTE